jgi:diguanylate cyclase (GGDEF)-like protein
VATRSLLVHAERVGTYFNGSGSKTIEGSPTDPRGSWSGRLERDLEFARDELAMLVEGQRRLLEVSQSVLASLDPAEVLELIADSLGALVTHDALVITEVDWAARKYIPTLARTSFVDAEAAATFLTTLNPIDGSEAGLAGWVIETGQPVNVIDAHEDPRAVQIPGTADVPEQAVVVPLYRHSVVAGTIKVARRALRDRMFTDAEFQLIQLFASLASIAIQNAQAHRTVVSQADTDALTGLLNHGAFERHLNDQLRRGPAGTFAVLLLDLDRFKAYNDTLGHPAGDSLLRQIAGAIRDSQRDSDRAYRYGGDEFTILLHGADADAARMIADRVGTAIAALTEGTTVHVTASVGVSCWPDDGSSALELVDAADRRAYAAKSARAACRGE